MKRLIAIALMILPLFGAELAWVESYDEAVKIANKEHKNIIVFIEAEHCPYCEQFKHDVLDTKDVISSLDKFVPLKLKIDSSDTKKHFPKASVTPTTYFITPNNEPLEEIIGSITEEFFYWRLLTAEREIEKLSKGK